MSSPPADPWAGQPEHDPTYGGSTPWPNDWSGSDDQPSYAGWPTAPQPGAPSTPPPAGPHPTLPYGGSATPHPTSPYGAPTPTSPYGGPVPPAPTSPYGFPPQHGGYPPAGYPGAPAGAPPPGRRPAGMAVTLSIIGVLALLLGGGGLVYFAADRDRPDDRDVHATPTAAPSVAVTGEPSITPSATPSPTAGSAPQIRLVTPDTVAGRPKSTDPTLQKLADDMVRDVRSNLSASSGVVGAFYGGAAERNLVMVVAVSAYVINPAAELDSALRGITDNLSVTGLTTIAPGPLGGVAKCGDGTSSKIPLGVCGWADNGSVGLVVVFHSSSAAAAAEFGTIRAAIEQRD